MPDSNTFIVARTPPKDEHKIPELIKKCFPFASLQEHQDPLFLNVAIPNKKAGATQDIRTSLRVHGLLDR